jgi:predicted acyl esterase
MKVRILVARCVAALMAPEAAGAQDEPDEPMDEPMTFRPLPSSVPIYDIQPPSVDPDLQRVVLEASDGTELFVETWLPATKDGNVPPERVPVIVTISPYLEEGEAAAGRILNNLVTRGYAYANAHVRGTGRSGGCIDISGAQEADDSARVIEYLGRDAPFSDGNVGGYGVSYPGGTILSVAGRGDPEKVKYLKALFAGAPGHSAHEGQWTFDGVPSFLTPLTMPGAYFLVSMGLFELAELEPPGQLPEPNQIPGRLECQVDHGLAGIDWSGNHSPWHRERDNRAWTQNIQAASFIVHGHLDLVPFGGVPPFIQRGLFDMLPEKTPKAGFFGAFGHSSSSYRAQPHFEDMLVAWFDRWLRGHDNGADRWPVVQVQGTDGQWRTEEQWPTTGGPVGQLALGPEGLLGVSDPSGSTLYLEGSYETTQGSVPGTSAEFQTSPVPGRLELTGQPVLDLWVTLNVPDAHIAARLEILDAEGNMLGHTYGMRSAQHLDPHMDGRFVQAEPRLPPVGEPVRVPVRFQPTDLVVPEGGSLRLIVAGSLIVNPGLDQFGIPEPIFLGPSQPSGVVAPVTIHHDCANPSTLRFLMPSPWAERLEFPEDTPAVRLGPPVDFDGGGMATELVCGVEPLRIEELGPALYENDDAISDATPSPGEMSGSETTEVQARVPPDPLPATGGGPAVGVGAWLALVSLVGLAVSLQRRGG